MASMENPLDAGNNYCVAGGTNGIDTIFNARNGHIYSASKLHGDDVCGLALSVSLSPPLPLSFSLAI